MGRSVLVRAVLLATILALAAPGGAGGASPGADARLPGAYKVQARVDEPELVLGEDKVRVTGQVRPYAPGRKVGLQQREAGTLRWETTGRARIKPSGRFVLKDRPTAPGLLTYRVVKPASAGIRWGRSETIEVAVRSWGALVEESVLSTCGIRQDVDVRLGGETYARSLRFEPPDFACIAHVTYDVGGRCLLLRAAFGMTDDSTSGSVAGISVSVASDPASTTSYRFSGDPTVFQDQVLDVSGADRLRIDMGVSYPPGIPGFPAVGNPEALCLP